jgi:hypothetical protein
LLLLLVDLHEELIELLGIGSLIIQKCLLLFSNKYRLIIELLILLIILECLIWILSRVVVILTCWGLLMSLQYVWYFLDVVWYLAHASFKIDSPIYCWIWHRISLIPSRNSIIITAFLTITQSRLRFTGWICSQTRRTIIYKIRPSNRHT